MSRILLIFCLLFCVTAIANQTSKFASPDDFTAFKESQHSKLEFQRELHAKEIEAARQQIAAVDKRVDDQLTQLGQSIDRFGILITILGLCITALLVLGGLLGYRNAKSEAKEAASEAAKASAQEWFDKQASLLKGKISAMEQKADQLHKEMDKHIEGVEAHAADVARALNTAQESIGKGTIATPANHDESMRVLAQRNEELKSANEDSYSFDDWSTRAHAAYAKGAFEDAAYFWLKAAKVLNAGAAKVAQVLVNRGIAQGQLNHHEDAIEIYDEVVRRFGEAEESAIQEQVAKSILNKGTIEGKMGRWEASIVTNEELLHRFRGTKHPALNKQAAIALFNKGVAQEKLEQQEAAVKTFGEVAQRFGEFSDFATREVVAKALINKGVILEKINEDAAAMSTYDEIIQRFSTSGESSLRVQVAKALIQKAGISAKVSDYESAVSDCKEAASLIGENTDLTLREQAMHALNAAGFYSLLKGKELMQSSKSGAQEQLQIALRNFNSAENYSTKPNGMIIGNKAYTHFLLGNSEAAKNDLAAALKAPEGGGKKLYEDTLKDLKIHPLVEDDNMRTLVERAWVDFQRGES